MNSRVVQREKMKASLSVGVIALEMKVKSHHFRFAFLPRRGGGCIHNNVAMLDLAFRQLPAFYSKSQTPRCLSGTCGTK
jgi:hypothetical protein